MSRAPVKEVPMSKVGQVKHSRQVVADAVKNVMGAPFNYDLERMKRCVEGPTIYMPHHPKSPGEVRRWLLEQSGKPEEDQGAPDA